MLIKIEGNKYNFIDSNDLYVGYDTSPGCCEDADWAIADKPTRYSDLDVEARDKYDVTGYDFDSACALLGITFEVDTNDLDAGDMAIFRLVHPEKPPLYLHLYNCHNGYYGHEVLTNLPFINGKVYL